MKLYIGNKNYSSWSYRVWLTMKVKGIRFEEDLRIFDVEGEYADYAEFSPTLKVPVLVHDNRTVWESLAILEYLAELFPEKGLWPENFERRTKARCLAHEMHAGFMPLRAACPMNMRRAPSNLDVDRHVRKDVTRIETIWSECLKESGGPFLFGDFSIVDGMYAPIVNRFAIYMLSDHEAVRQYSDTMTALQPWKDWAVASAEEPWVVDIDEV